jgi:hypothetical protein
LLLRTGRKERRSRRVDRRQQQRDDDEKTATAPVTRRSAFLSPSQMRRSVSETRERSSSSSLS